MDNKKIMREINELQSSDLNLEGIKCHEKINEVILSFWGDGVKKYKPAGLHSTESEVYVYCNGITEKFPIYMIRYVGVCNSKTIRKDESNKGLFDDRRYYDAHEALLFKEESESYVIVNEKPPIMLYDPEIQFLLMDNAFDEVDLDDESVFSLLNSRDNPLVYYENARRLNNVPHNNVVSALFDIVEEEKSMKCTHHITIEALTGESKSLLNARLMIINNFLVIAGRDKISMEQKKIYISLNVIERISYKRIDRVKNKTNTISIFDDNSYRFMFSDIFIKKLKDYGAWL